MRNAYMLKDTTFSVDYDFPREIQEARSRLWPQYKEMKRKFPRDKIQIVYPAKLLRNNHIVCDELPDWNACVNGNKLHMLREICDVKCTNENDMQVTSSNSACMMETQFSTESMVTNSKEDRQNNWVPNAHDKDIRLPAATTTNRKQDMNISMETQHICDVMDRHESIIVQQRKTGVNTEITRDELSQALDNVFSTVHSKSEETAVKTLQCDAANPIFAKPNVDTPRNSRSRPTKREEKSKQRSASAVPYRRHSVSKTRAEKSRAVSQPKNRKVNINNCDTNSSVNMTLQLDMNEMVNKHTSDLHTPDNPGSINSAPMNSTVSE